MADIKWSAFPAIGALATGDILVGLRAGANVKFNALTLPWSPALGGTGVANAAGSTLTLGAAHTLSGAFASTFTFTGITSVTFPTSGTLATTAGASGIVNSGLINQLAYYAAAGAAVSGLATANNGLLVTSAGGAPSIGNAILADITINGLKAGVGAGAGTRNTAFGLTALGTGTGADNTGLGRSCGISLTSGADNTFGGSTTGYQVTTGNYHTAFGSNALGGALTGDSNSAFGYFALNACTGTTNSVFGRAAGAYVTTGAGNTLLGANVCTNLSVGVRMTTGSGNIVIGSASSVDDVNASNTICIGRNAIGLIATGATSANTGPSCTLGSSAFPVGFRGDGSIWPSTTGAGFWRPVINGTAYMVPLIASGATAWPAITTASIAFSTTSGIIGTTTNNNAAAGSVGELISSPIISASAVSLSDTTQQNVTSISLTAGDWDIWGNISYVVAGTTLVTTCLGWISVTSATIPDAFQYLSAPRNGLGSSFGINVPAIRVSLSGTTTYYLSTYQAFTVSTMTACGGIYARRRR